MYAFFQCIVYQGRERIVLSKWYYVPSILEK
jgi:hypothetical protein